MASLLSVASLGALASAGDDKLNLHTASFEDIGTTASAVGWGFIPDGCDIPVIVKTMAIRIPQLDGSYPYLVKRENGAWCCRSTKSPEVSYSGTHPALIHPNLDFFHVESVIPAGQHIPMHAFRMFDKDTRVWAARHPQLCKGLVGFLPLNQGDTPEELASESEKNAVARIHAAMWSMGLPISSCYEEEFGDTLPQGIPHLAEMPDRTRHNAALAAFSKRLTSAIPVENAGDLAKFRRYHGAVRQRRLEIRERQQAKNSERTPRPSNASSASSVQTA